MRMVSIIIVNHNTGSYTERCLASIVENYDGQYQYDIIVVDNASTDTSVQQLRQVLPRIHLIENETNVGFGRANNQAMRVARGDLLLLLNPDTIVLGPAVTTMLEELEEDETTGILGCQVLNPDLSIQPSAGHFPTVRNLILNRLPCIGYVTRSYFIRRESYYRRQQQPDWIMGACMMIRRTLIEEVGMFDEDYFMYGEDVDLCYRARRGYYGIRFTPDARIIHYDLGRTAFNRLGKFVMLRKGLLLFYRKHYAPGDLVKLKLVMGLEVAARLLLARDPRRQGAYRAVLRAIRE